ncbi:MAG: PspA/IM30 family protein [Acidimicrobiales bacterium]|nr:PspA/IM30 family protein [Acidimicrobiales bacterium]
MSLFRRLSDVFQQKANAALDKAENPTQALDLSYQKLLEQLQQVRRSIADVLTAQKRLEGQRSSLQAQYNKLQGQARQALTQGQEDLARTALTRGQTIQAQVEQLGPQIEQLKTQESQLEVTGQNLQAKVEEFRAHKDTMKAQYTAAKATTEAMEGMTGLSEHMADVSLMIDRAQDKVNSMQARAAAVGELSDSGIMDQLQLGGGGGDDIERQLRAVGTGQNVDAQLASLKGELGLGPSPDTPAIEAGKIVVRVAGDQQYELPEAVRPALDGLDVTLVRAVQTGDEAGFTQCRQQLLKLVTSSGTQLPPDDNRASDVIVPSADMTLADAKKLMADNGADDYEAETEAESDKDVQQPSASG